MINYCIPYQYFYIWHMHYYYNRNFVECLLTRVKPWIQEITIRIQIIQIWWDSNWYNLFADSPSPNLRLGSGIRTLLFHLGVHRFIANMSCGEKLLYFIIWRLWWAIKKSYLYLMNLYLLLNPNIWQSSHLISQWFIHYILLPFNQFMKLPY